MGNEVRIGVEPEPTPPRPSGKGLAAAAALVMLAALGAWLLGVVGREPATTSTTITAHLQTTTLVRPLTTTTAGGPTTTATLADRLQRARTFWVAMGAGDTVAALATVPDPTAASADLIAFITAFHPGFTVSDCEEFAANAVACLVVVPDEDLLTIGSGTADQVLTVADDGRFDIPSILGSAAARLSLYALEAHTEEVRAACPLNGNPPVLRLAIVGSPTAGCGAYLAGLIPEYLSLQGLRAGPRQ